MFYKVFRIFLFFEILTQCGMEEQQLIRLLKQRDRQAYRELFDQYFYRLFSFAVHVVFREDVANDIVQEIFIQLYEKTEVLNYDISLKTYLFNSVRNRCFNYLRDRKVEDRRKSLYAEACIWAETTDCIEEEDVLHHIREALEELPEKCRDICKLRFLEGKKFEEIASELNVSESTIRVQTSRGMEKLRNRFAGEDWNVVLFFMTHR